MWAFMQFRMACAGPSVLGRDNLTEMRGEGDGETAAGILQAQAGLVGTAVLHKPTVEACKRALTKDGSGEQANSHHPLYWEGLLHRDVKCYYTPLCPPLKEKNLNVSITKGFGGLLIHSWEMTDNCCSNQFVAGIIPISVLAKGIGCLGKRIMFTTREDLRRQIKKPCKGHPCQGRKDKYMKGLTRLQTCVSSCLLAVASGT